MSEQDQPAEEVEEAQVVDDSVFEQPDEVEVPEHSEDTDNEEE